MQKMGGADMGFFARQAATDARLLKRSCESLIGLCRGMLADGYLADEEILFLKNWLDENDMLAVTWPGEVVYKRINQVLADGVIDEDERKYLTETLDSLIGGTMQETGATEGLSTNLPVEDVELVDLDGNLFCFTGTFLYGTRAACHKATESAGGVAAKGITKKLNYLVIGTNTTQSWANTSFGRKIEKAVDYRNSGIPLAIISEACWISFLPVSK